MSDLLKRIANLSPEKRGILAQKLKGAQKAAPAPQRIAGRSDTAAAPLSYAQQRLWFLDQLRPGDATYNIPAAVRLRRSLNVTAMEGAFSEIIRRHEILRTTFPAVDGRPRQVVGPALPVSLPVTCLMRLPAAEREGEARRLAAEEAACPFDLATGPLLRLGLIRLDTDDHVLLFTMHHIIGDGWSLGVMVRELGALYEAFSEGRPSPLPEMTIQYSDYALWQQEPFHQQLFAQQLDYWKAQLAGLEFAIDLPADRPRPPVQSFRGSVAEAELDERLSRAVLEMGQREGATLFMTMLAGFYALLQRYTGQDDLAVGTDVANRNWSQTEGLIGFFINQLTLRADLSGDPTFRELLRRVREISLDGFANQDLPFERLVAALQPQRSLSYTPLFQVKFVVQNTPAEEISLTGLTLEPFPVHNGTVGFDLILTVVEAAGRLQISLEYNTDIFEAATIRRMLGHYETLLRSAAENPARRVSELNLLTPPERRALLPPPAARHAAPPDCLHHLFERRAAADPDRPALVCAGRTTSYRDLNERANRLARRLRSLGVGPEVRVGLCLERGEGLVAALLGVLKAGGAYVPLDPGYPSERLADMLEDSAVPILLTQEHLLDRLPAVWSLVICLDAERDTIEGESAENPEHVATPRNAAYVIYTSGSTGKPKGVVVEHRGLANLAAWQASNFGLTPDSRISQFASFSFDAAVGETCMALLNGATLVMLEREELDSQGLIEAVNQHRINVMVMVPSMLKALDPDALQHPEELTVVAVGEACPPELASRWSRRCRFMNAYGPTEYTVYSHLWKVESGDSFETGAVPIGFPIFNTRTYILDPKLNPVSEGVTGEIYISGPGMARGYLNKPGVTASRFLPNPFLVHEYFSDHRPLEDETASAEIREFKREGQPRRGRATGAGRLESARRPSPPAVFKLIESLSPDLIKKTHSFIARHGEDDAVYGAFTRYLIEGINDSYASCGINAEVLRRLLPFESFAGLSGVDFGFGNGEVLKTLRGMGARVKGLDFNPVFVQKARDAGLDAAMARVDVEPEAFPSEAGVAPGSQDFAVSTLLLDRLANPLNSLRNLFLSLKGGGRFAIQTLLPIVGVDDGEVEDPLTYTPAAALIAPGKDAEEDKAAMVGLLLELGAGDIEVYPLPYVVNSRDGLQDYTVWSFTGVKNPSAAREASADFSVMYRTGDRGRFLRGGAIEFRGRADAQVKIRGFRIEVGEIETCLSSHPAVKDCAVVALDTEQGGKRLVAYVAAGGGAQQPGAADLTEFLRRKLPDFMVPSAFVMLERLPLLPNGKLDSKKLPPPVEAALERPAGVEPRNHVEQALADAWRQVLNLERVGVHDNIFELGGDSILILQILAKLNQSGIHLTSKQFFKHQTIAELAEAASSNRDGGDEQAAVSGEVWLTPIQRWFFAQELDEPHHYNQSVALRARGPLDPRILAETFRALVSHHDALRLRFRRGAGGWQQFNAEADAHDIFSRSEVRGSDEAEMWRAVEAEAAELQAGLNLGEGPLMKARLFSFGGRMPDCLLIVVHHLAVDGVSWRILLEDLHAVYGQLARGEAAALPPKTSSWRTWAARLRELSSSAELDEDAAYWLGLSRIGGARLPVDGPGGENREEFADAVRVALTREESQEIVERVPKALRSSVNELLLAAVGSALSSWASGPVPLELEGHGREDLFDGVDVSRTVGWFTSLYPVRLDFGGARGPADAVAVVKDTLRAVPRRGIGFGLLLSSERADHAPEALRAMPQAEVSFNYLGHLDQVLRESALFDTALDIDAPDHSPAQRRRYLLEVSGYVAGRQLHLDIRFNTQSHRRATVEALAERVADFLRSAVALSREPRDFDLRPSDFPLAAAALGSLSAGKLSELLGGSQPENIHPLTPMQQGMLFHSLADPASGVYVNQMSCALRGELDVAAFRAAWEEVIRRHSILRTSFTWGALPEPLAVVSEHAPLSFAEEDWRGFSEAELGVRLHSLKERDRLRGFELSQAPLMRLTLVRTGDDSYDLIWSFHHLLLDGWSVYLVLKDVFALYEGARAGSPVELGPALPYSGYIEWLTRQDLTKAEAFWRKTLRGLTAPTHIPANKPAAAGAAEAPSGFAEYRTKLGAEASAALQSLSRQQRLTMNTIVQGAWALLLSRYTDSDDVTFGTVVSGRPASLKGVEQTVGLFINTLPVRVRVSRDALVLDWLHELQSRLIEMGEYEYSPLLQVQAWSEVPRGASLFNSILAFENYPIDDSLTRRSARLSVEDIRSIEQTNYPISVMVAPGAELSLGIIFDQSRFDIEAVRRMMGHYEVLLEAVAADPSRPLSALPLLPPSEQRALLRDWNRTAAPA
ncbi:MAG TPA: amino acid adenylation domain-containing protein, partial [Pyrinomonadaceae bacterium]|nr:amino acid adenylation domain-containing protein [Pyrinomonadaceae bacterium]